jgi:hypothetical protein
LGGATGASPVTTFITFLFLFLATGVFGGEVAKGAPAFPKSVSGYRADGKVETYDRETVYKYMDGGAEIYLEYGMKSLVVQKYAKKGEPPIVFDLFEMDSSEGAFGAFTFEREDEGVELGQGSEYGGGLLRFWQGRYFAFVQSEKETPASKEAVLALGRAVVASLGVKGAEPRLPEALKSEDFRARSVRYVLSPLLLEVLEPQFGGNPLGLPSRCEAVLGRYGAKGNTQRVVLVRFPDEKASAAAVGALLQAWTKGSAEASEPFLGGGTWAAAGYSGPIVAIVLGAVESEAASKRLVAVIQKLPTQSVRKNLWFAHPLIPSSHPHLKFTE